MLLLGNFIIKERILLIIINSNLNENILVRFVFSKCVESTLVDFPLDRIPPVFPVINKIKILCIQYT